MTTPTNAPTGVNAPVLPIVWCKLSEMWSATSAERAFIGPYELIAFDLPPAGLHPRIIAWELHTGPKFMTGIAGASADSFEAAKRAAEEEARRLLIVTEVSTLIPSLGLTFTEASAKVFALFDEYDAFAKANPGDDPPNDLVTEACDIRHAMFTTAPRTPADALAVLNLLANDDAGLTAGNRVEEQETAVVLLRDFMAPLTGKGFHTEESPRC